VGRSTRNLICVLACAALLGGTKGVEDPTTVVRVNGTGVNRWEVYAEINRILPMASYHGSVSPEAWKRVVDDALEAAVERELEYQEAVRRGLHIPKGTLDKAEKEAINRAGSEKAFRESLRASGVSREDFRRFKRKILLVEELRTQVAAGIEKTQAPSDAALKRYYAENREKFVIPPSVDIQQILLRVPPWASAQEWERGERRAKWIAERARSGEDFTRLAKIYSDDEETKAAGGVMKAVHEGSLISSIEKLVGTLPPGAVGGPVRSLYGYHIVKLLARHPARQLEFTQINREKLRADLRRKAIREAMDDWQRGLRKGAQVVFDQDQVELLRSPQTSMGKGPKAGARETE
jgi:parvulin-like peptidyl-prolyl isomerase